MTTSISLSKNYVNLDYLNKITGENLYLMIEIIDNFKLQRAELLNELLYTKYNVNYDAIAHLSHKIKSCIYLVGLDKLRDVLNEIELYATNNENHPELPSIIEFIDSTFTMAFIEIDEILNNLKS